MNTESPYTPTGTATDKVLIAYHANCIDGFTSAWVTAEATKNEGKPFEFMEMHYTQDYTDKLMDTVVNGTYKVLYVVDFSLKKSVLLDLQTLRPDTKIIILDHHKTAFEEYGYEDDTGHQIANDSRFYTHIHEATLILDMAHCGASLCWEHFFPFTPQPELIKYVKDYDLWLYEYGDETKWINKHLNTLDKNLCKWREIYRLLEKPYAKDYILKKGKELQKAHDKEVADVIVQAHPYTLLGEKGLAVMCPSKLTSDVGHKLSKTSGTFGFMINIHVEKGIIVFSLRSNGDYDVSRLAKKMGGGGHKNAAGFTLPIIQGGEGVDAHVPE